MSITKEEVRYVAKLARLYLDEEETSTFTTQLDKILDHIKQLDEIDVENVLPTSQNISSENVLRDDNVDNVFGKDICSKNISLKNAPLEEEGFFKVPKVIE